MQAYLTTSAKFNPYEHEFPNEKKYCKAWSLDYTKLQSLFLIVPLAITFLNWLTKFILRKFAPMEKHNSIANEKRRTTFLLASTMVINTGGVILLVNINTFGRADWYRKVGAVIATTMLTTIPINNILNPAFTLPKFLK